MDISRELEASRSRWVSWGDIATGVIVSVRGLLAGLWATIENGPFAGGLAWYQSIINSATEAQKRKEGPVAGGDLGGGASIFIPRRPSSGEGKPTRGGSVRKKTGEEEGKDLLASLTDEMNRSSAADRVAAVTAELLKDKYKGLTQATRELILAEALKIDQANARKAAMDLLTKTGQQAADSLFELTAGTVGSVTELERFEYALSKIPQSARPAQAEIDKVRQSLQKVIDERSSQDVQKKTREILNAIFNLREAAKRELSAIGFDTSTNLGRLLESVSQIEGVSAPVEKLRALVDVFKQLGNIDPVFQKQFSEDAIQNLKLAKPPDVTEKDWLAFLQFLSEASLAAQQLDDKLRDQSARESYEQALRALNDELRQLNEETATQRLEYELTEGTLKSLSEAQKNYLRQKAREVDILRETKQARQEDKEEVQDFGEELENTVSGTAVSSLSTNIHDLATGFKTAKEAALDFFLSLLDSIQQAIIKMLVLRAVSAITGLFSGGSGGWAGIGAAAVGIGAGHAEGGHIRGPGTETSDSIPAWLSDNEFVQPARAVKHYGVQFMEAIRTLTLPRSFANFAQGGLASRLLANLPAPRYSFADGGLVQGSGPESLLNALNGNSNTSNYNISLARPEDHRLRLPSRAALRDAARTLGGK